MSLKFFEILSLMFMLRFKNFIKPIFLIVNSFTKINPMFVRFVLTLAFPNKNLFFINFVFVRLDDKSYWVWIASRSMNL